MEGKRKQKSTLKQKGGMEIENKNDKEKGKDKKKIE